MEHLRLRLFIITTEYTLELKYACLHIAVCHFYLSVVDLETCLIRHDICLWSNGDQQIMQEITIFSKARGEIDFFKEGVLYFRL